MEDITLRAKLFFDILPADWQASIIPYWAQYQKSAKVYVIKGEVEICAGGMVFSTVPPEMDHFEKEAIYWLKKGYAYIGFVWVPVNKRKKNLGSQWLTELKKLDPSQKYWLTTEERDLKSFYLKNGFRYVRTLFYKDMEEDLFVFDGE